MNIFLDLFLTFFKIGAFTFGGGYAMLPLMQEEVLAHKWMELSSVVNFIAVSDGAIAFTHSNCPGQDCVHSGSIHSTGRSLVCLPNRVEIRVVSGGSDVDFVVG